jgi:hypothetical protein
MAKYRRIMNRATANRIRKIKVGDTVVVNKDIFRTTEGYKTDPEWLAAWERYKETYDVNLRPQIPPPELYASKDEVGVILEVFTSWAGKHRSPHWNVKVKIGDKIKTFKIASVDKKED